MNILTTGTGEVFSDYLVTNISPIIAFGLAGMVLLGTLILQFSVLRYVAWIYWTVIMNVSIFGTMVDDLVDVVLGVPNLVSTIFTVW